MKVPIEISYKNLSASSSLNSYVRQRAEHLERICREIVSCRVAIELEQNNHRTGKVYRMRVETNVPPGHDLVAVRERSDEELPFGLRTLARETFDALESQVGKTKERKRGIVKHHEAGNTALVVQLDPDKGFGFLQGQDGTQYYFHRNGVLHDEFERLTVGTEVRFEEHEGEQGLQASSVQIVNKPGATMGRRRAGGARQAG